MNTKVIFNNHSFDVINKDNELWIKSSDLARAIGYSQENAVTKIYNRHSDEFSASMTRIMDVSKLGMSEKSMSYDMNLKNDVRFFSLRGAHLVAMFAKTKISKGFRKWVLDILDEEIKKPISTNKSLSKAQQEAHAIVLLDKQSFEKASKGAKDMNARKRAIREVRARVMEWENKYQIKLDMHMPSGFLN